MSFLYSDIVTEFCFRRKMSGSEGGAATVLPTTSKVNTSGGFQPQQPPSKPGRSSNCSKSNANSSILINSSSSRPMSSVQHSSIFSQGQSNNSGSSSDAGNYSVKASQSKPRSRFSLRRLFYTNPLLSPPFAQTHSKKKLKKGCEKESPFTGVRGVRETLDNQSDGSWMTSGAGERDNYSTSSSVGAGSGHSDPHPSGLRECSLCLAETVLSEFPNLRNCHHLSCIVCLQQYVRIEIQEGRVNLKCPQCSETLHPNDIEMLVGEDSSLLNLYESLMLRRVLAADPDTRWCPAPNCTFAVVATGCASCPKINCEREDCDFSFCYHCKAGVYI